MSTSRRALLAGLGVAGLAGCAGRLDPSPASTSPTASGRPSSAGAPSSSQSTTPTPSGPNLSLEQQVGQLFAVGWQHSTMSDPLTGLLERRGVGTVVLLGNELGGRSQVAGLTSSLTSLDVPVPVLVAVDQEGGQVQRLSGSGFSTIPAATTQAELPADDLEGSWTTWAKELARAGVRYNLAPVADHVRPDLVSSNAPIGQLQRQYGSSPKAVAARLPAVIAGHRAAGVATSLKHFPGLGEVTTNTDFGVATDTTTRRSADQVAAFTAGVRAGASSVMVSSAIYQHIDPKNPAVFSRTIITDWLRAEVAPEAVVVSDDLGAAASVGDVEPAQRALRFFGAGGDLLINADPESMPTMLEAVIGRARKDAGFADHVRTACARVLRLKGAN